MPKVATFDGIKIWFYHNEHPPPHFHVTCAEHQAVIDIDTMRVERGYLPIAQRRKVMAWAKPRRAELIRAFIQAANHDDPEPIQ